MRNLKRNNMALSSYIRKKALLLSDTPMIEDLIMCEECFSENKFYTTTTFTVENDKRVIIVSNVPCLKCQVCGEVTFSDDVSARLEQIVNAAKNLLQDVFVIDFSVAVAGKTSIYDEPNRSHLRIAMDELDAGHGEEHELAE